jgi:3-hydroxyacyl-[acyl-carrier-protein] dehydratase
VATNWQHTGRASLFEQLFGAEDQLMEFFPHTLHNVEDYLHHRPPYLLVKRIESITPTSIITETTFAGDEFFLEGHFPGAPVLPGAMMQEVTTQSGGILIAAKYNPMRHFNTHDPQANEYALGVLVRVHQARYRSFARPGDMLKIQVDLDERVANMFDFSARISVAGHTIMQNCFRLANIKSTALAGA